LSVHEKLGAVHDCAEETGASCLISAADLIPETLLSSRLRTLGKACEDSGMISRIWHGWTSHQNADLYEKLLKEDRHHHAVREPRRSQGVCGRGLRSMWSRQRRGRYWRTSTSARSTTSCSSTARHRVRLRLGRHVSRPVNPGIYLASGRCMAHLVTTVAEGLGAWLLVSTVVGLIVGHFIGSRAAVPAAPTSWQAIRPMQRTSAV
jgi:hypothetical protein